MEENNNNINSQTDLVDNREEIRQGAPLLGKGIWILFWMFIPSILANIMSNETMIEWVPVLYLPGQTLQIACLVIYNLVLLKMSPAERRYRNAGICGMISAGITVVLLFIPGSGESVAWTALLAFPAAIVAFVGEYYEYTGHAEVLSGVDLILSEKWRTLWRWYVGLLIAAVAGILVLFMGMLAFAVLVIGGLVVLAAAIGILVVGILKLVYLYRTARVFRN